VADDEGDAEGLAAAAGAGAAVGVVELRDRRRLVSLRATLGAFVIVRGTRRQGR
jgi:hypothetical protein